MNDRPTFIRGDGIIVLTGVPLYRCRCGKSHITGVWTSTMPRECPCGEPFPPDEFIQYRAA